MFDAAFACGGEAPICVKERKCNRDYGIETWAHFSQRTGCGQSDEENPDKAASQRHISLLSERNGTSADSKFEQQQSDHGPRNCYTDQNDGEVAADPYAEDRELVPLLTVWSLRDAAQVQRLLDIASIPFYMGAEYATGVDTVTSNFATGVGVKIMRIGLPWAWQALRYYEPKDDPESEKAHWDEEVDVRCPKCRATDIVFVEEVASANGPAHKYKWTCGICGNHWEDDGVATR
jgi:hypothetical protein